MAANEAHRDGVVLARLRRPWGRQGELILELHTDWPEDRFKPGTRLRLAWDNGRETERVVRGYRELQQGAMLAFEGALDISAAEDLAGAWVVADPATLAPVEAGEDDWRQADLVGAEVVNVAGEHVGRVAEIEEGARTDLIRVELANGRDALVPLAPAICVRFEGEGDARRLVIDPPRGLLDLDEAEQA